ncbi:MAG: holo-ACP synthase [Thermotogota bacterium]|nr:holo-ACP synthase [Thermotogota bacterium]
MNKLSCGIDIVKVDRVTDELAGRILGDKEASIYNTFLNESRKREFAAGRFAAKEAFVKASNMKELDFKSIQFINDEAGCPIPDDTLKNMVNISEISVSISHEHDYAVAVVVMLKGED